MISLGDIHGTSISWVGNIFKISDWYKILSKLISWINNCKIKSDNKLGSSTKFCPNWFNNFSLSSLERCSILLYKSLIWIIKDA